MGLPKEVYSGNASVLSSQFRDTLFSLSSIEQHSSVPYKPATNGRAEMAVKSVGIALRHFLTPRPRSWYHALTLALWGLHDLPGLVAPYSPHRLVFGREPVWFGEVPPTVLGDGAEDAHQFFSRLVTDRPQVKDALKRLQDKESSALRKTFKVQPFRGGDRVWLRDRPKWDTPHYNKLKHKWQGPYEVVRWAGGDRNVIQVGEVQKVVASDRLKLYRSIVQKLTAPFRIIAIGTYHPAMTHIWSRMTRTMRSRGPVVPRLNFSCMWLGRIMRTRRGGMRENSLGGGMIGLNAIARAMIGRDG